MIITYDLKISCELYDKSATLYKDDFIPPRAVILYFHSGGLLYGSRKDLPSYHIKEMCAAGLAILAIDYVLAPAVKLSEITRDVNSSINWYLNNRMTIFSAPLPYFLWGRSAGGYLCLLTLKSNFDESPAGILSYYGYGLLCDDWYRSPSEFYCRYPRVSKECLSQLSSHPCSFLSIDSAFPAYVYLRQQGIWSSVFSDKDIALIADFSLRGYEPSIKTCPMFFAHSTNDTDVPFSEFSALIRKFESASRYVVSITSHDFDRDTDSPLTKGVISESISFINSAL